MSMRRVEAEMLDHLPATDLRAQRSRHDLQRVNRVMGSLPILTRLLDASLAHAPLQIAELGAGDGSLMLRLATRQARRWRNVTVTLVDRQDLVSDATREAYDALGWTLATPCADVFCWLASGGHPRYDAIVANLFIHHFDDDALVRMFRAIAPITQCFVACEPRRARIALLGSHLVGALGANAVTRQDAVLSVYAGFRARELSAHWPAGDEWRLNERNAGLFSHAFSAVRRPDA